MTLIWFVIVLGIIVFVHELGHFLVAKWCGVYVDCFSLGFGPRLLWLKIGETEYRISAIPLGGYVRMAYQFDIPEEYDKEAEERYKDVPVFRRYDKQSVPKRMAIIVAGPFMNLIFALPIAFALLVLGTPQTINSNATTLGSVVAGTPAANAGLEAGDKIISIDGTSVNNWNDLTTLISYKIGQETKIDYLRNGKEEKVVLIPELNEEKGYMGIGVTKLKSLQVGSISSNSPATKSNLQVGDVINNIIGTSKSKISSTEFLNYIKENPGKLIVLGVRRYPENRYFSDSNTFTTAKIPITIGKVGKFKNIVITEFEDGSYISSAPEVSTVKKLDKVTKINGEKVTPETINEKIHNLSPGTASITIERIEGKIVKKLFTTNVVLTVVSTGYIGAGFNDANQIVKRHTIAAIMASPKRAYKELVGVLNILRMLIQKKLGLKNLAGPVGIARITGIAAKAGASGLLFIMLMLTVNLGILNLLPLPVLDGGHVVLLFAEGIYRKALPIKFVLWYQKIGFTFLMLLMAYVLYNDIIRWVMDSDKLGLLLGKLF